MAPVATARLAAALPDFADAAGANWSFHQRAARWLARERGISQFLDFCPGLPAAGHAWDVVGPVSPAARVVCVDVGLGARLPAAPPSAAGRTALIRADLRSPDAVFGHPGLRALIDTTAPVAVLATAVMDALPASAGPWGLVRRYLRVCAPGSYLVLSHATGDRLPPSARWAPGQERGAGPRLYLRPRDQVEEFFDGLDLIPPYHGAAPEVCFVGEWGAEDPEAADGDGSRLLYCGVGRLP